MRLFFLLLCLAISTRAQGTKAVPDRGPSEKIDANALLREIVGMAPRSAREIAGVLKIRDADGGQKKVPIRWTMVPLTNQWHDIFQTPQGTELPSEVLRIIHASSANVYEFSRGGEKVHEASTNLFIPFGASDFWLADLGLEFLHWPNAKHVKTEMRKSRPCYVIETLNPNPKKNEYPRVLSWIDTEHGGLIRAEAYTANGKLWKEFSIGSIKKVDGRWQIKELHIRNDLTDTDTRLEFELNTD